MPCSTNFSMTLDALKKHKLQISQTIFLKSFLNSVLFYITLFQGCMINWNQIVRSTVVSQGFVKSQIKYAFILMIKYNEFKVQISLYVLPKNDSVLAFTSV